ncbi:MAG: acyl-homoserine-lactone synthase [Paracoccaceae bacterium]
MNAHNFYKSNATYASTILKAQDFPSRVEAAEPGLKISGDYPILDKVVGLDVAEHRPINVDLGALGLSETLEKVDIDTDEEKYAKGSFSLRHQVFNEKLQWQVTSYDKQEIDEFDLLKPWYITIVNNAGSVVGSWRALPTTGPNMLRDVFPDVARGEAIPEDKNIWEISRFAVDEMARSMTSDAQKLCVASITRELVETFQLFAEERGIVAFVAVTSVAAEKLLKRLGLKTRRMGDGKPVKIGRVLTTAIWIEFDDVPETFKLHS